jgi:hypothetical protein
MLRILNISGMPPVRAGDGSAATLATVVALCRLGHEVTLAYLRRRRMEALPDATHELVQAAEGRLRVVPLDLTDRWGRCGLALRLAMGQPGVAARWAASRLLLRPASVQEALRRWLGLRLPWGRATVHALERLLASAPFDVVQVEYPWMVSLGRVLPASPPRVFVVHELQSEIVALACPDRPALAAGVRQTEFSELRRFDALIALVPEDELLLREQAGLEAVFCSPLSAPRGLPLEPPPVRTAGRLTRFTFLGGYGNPPNADAIRWLNAELVPALRAALPGFQLEIVGRYPEEFARAHTREDVVFRGFVEDPTQALDQSIFLCPIRIGSGMRVKILDAILSGAAVISTTVGARGLGLTPGEHLLLADSAEDFVREAVRLAADATLRDRLARAALRRVREQFLPEHAAARRVDVLRQIMAGKVARQGIE